MFEVKTIVAPIDFSERSVAAAEHAVRMAKHFDAHLILAHVALPLPYANLSYVSGYHYGWAEPEMETKRETFFKGRLNALADKVSLGRAPETIVLEGDVAEEIEGLQRKRNCDLLILPTHGYGPFRRMLLGSVTTRLLGHVTCPVFTGTHIEEIPPFEAEPYRRVACAMSLSETEDSDRLLSWARGFAEAHQAGLTVLHALPEEHFRGKYEDIVKAEYWEKASHSVHIALEKAIADAGCKAGILVTRGDVIPCVLGQAEKAGADVLIIGRSAQAQARGGARGHGYEFIRESPCPVISV
jgi:nucleotide-binding universal stress UspA family protein